MATHHIEAVSSEIEYFGSEALQAGIVAEYDRDFIPISTLQAGAPIEFLVRGADGLFLDLNDSKIEVRCKLVRADGANLVPGTDFVGVVNNTLNSLFTNIEVELGGKIISDPSNLYPYRAYLETLLSVPKDVLETRCVVEGFELDTAEQLDALLTAANTSDNGGLVARTSPNAASATVTLIG